MVLNRNPLIETIGSSTFNIQCLIYIGGVRGILVQKPKFGAPKVYNTFKNTSEPFYLNYANAN